MLSQDYCFFLRLVVQLPSSDEESSERHPMAYCNFTLPGIKRQLHYIINETTDLFASAGEVRGSPWLPETLRETLPLALAVHTEKSRSALLIAPMLVELRKLAQHQVNLFSGIDFSVDPVQGLNGVCDFIVSQSPEQLFVSAPVLIVVEAKNENIKGDLVQCIAAMIAARLFNDPEGAVVAVVDGAVTAGTNWRFLKLEPGLCISTSASITSTGSRRYWGF